MLERSTSVDNSVAVVPAAPDARTEAVSAGASGGGVGAERSERGAWAVVLSHRPKDERLQWVLDQRRHLTRAHPSGEQIRIERWTRDHGENESGLDFDRHHRSSDAGKYPLGLFLQA